MMGKLVGGWSAARIIAGVLATLAFCTPAAGSAQAAPNSATVADSSALARLGVSDTNAQSAGSASAGHHQRKVTRQLGELEPVLEWQWGAVLATVLAMIGAIVLTLPVAAVYKLTRPANDFDPGVMHSSLILAPTIAGILIVIQGSLAMAFSLAGVVTAVRFRNSLKDTNDAVFVFVSVAVGLAAGGQALDIALAISIIFSALVLILAKSPFRVSEPIHPGHKHAGHDRQVARSPGEEQLGSPLQALGPHPNDASRLEIVVRGSQLERGRPLIEAMLDRSAKHWWLDRAALKGEGGETLRYAVRLRKRVPRDQFLEQLGQAARSAGLVAEATSEPFTQPSITKLAK